MVHMYPRPTLISQIEKKLMIIGRNTYPALFNPNEKEWLRLLAAPVIMSMVSSTFEMRRISADEVNSPTRLSAKARHSRQPGTSKHSARRYDFRMSL